MPSAYAGHFNDGETAERRAVTVSLAPAALEITDAAGALLASWPYAELQAVDPLRPGAAPRLGIGATSEARLMLADAAILEELKARAPQLVSRRRLSGRDLRRGGLVLSGVVAAAAAFWFFWPPLADAIAGAVPLSWEDRLGRQFVDGMSADHGVCTDPAGTAVLDALVARLAANAGNEHPLTVQVIDHPAVNAFAAPGGRVVLLRGLLDTAESPDEVAGVLAHEIGHVVERHGMRSLVRYFGLMLLGQVFAGGTDLAEAAPVLLTLAYSRDFETEADRRAVDLLVHAGIRADGLSRFFVRLEREEGDLPTILAYLSSHPSTAERRRATTPEAVSGEPALTAEEWAALRRICGEPD